MEHSQVIRRSEAWSAAVDLFLETKVGRAALAAFNQDYEQSALKVLFLWVIPVLEDVSKGTFEAIREENQALLVWKNRLYTNAWHIFTTGRCAKAGLSDSMEEKRAFKNLVDWARAARADIEKHVVLVCEPTPVVEVSDSVLEQCVPSIRRPEIPTRRVEDIHRQSSPDLFLRIKEFAEYQAMQRPVGVSEESELRSKPSTPKTIKPPPTIHPTDPNMRLDEMMREAGIEVAVSTPAPPRLDGCHEDGPEIEAEPSDLDPEELLKD